MKLSGFCYGYVNVSPSKQSKPTSNKEYQENLIREFAEKKGMKLMRIHYDECEDIPMMERSGYAEVIRWMTRGDALLVSKISRLTADELYICKITTQLEDKKCALFSITENTDTTVKMGKFTIRMNVFKKDLKTPDE